MLGIYHLVIRRFIICILYISNFDVTMGSYDGVEVCELSGIFMLSLSGNKYNSNNIGLYRNDGLAIFKNTSGRNLNKSKRFFKNVYEQRFRCCHKLQHENS